jgi:Domain of unknown function (DUF1932)/NAD binding domain of 6-phosphogluconate dehydrogenase
MKPTESNPAATVGILYCGDMGSAFGKLLRKGGLRVVTTCEGRSRATQEQAQNSGIEILPTLNDVVSQSHIVFSLVLPSSAVEVARRYASRRSLRPPDSVFVDANSIGLETLEEIERLMSEQNVPLVDASFHGVAHRLEDLAILYVSGPKARVVEALCQDFLPVSYLGKRIGSATAMKLLMAGISKGLAGLFVEVGAIAERADMLDPFLDSCRHFYPAVMTVIDRILPTYPRHAARRVGEVREIEQLGHASQLRPGMIHEAGRWIQMIAGVQWDQMRLEAPADVRTIVHSVARACSPENPKKADVEV